MAGSTAGVKAGRAFVVIDAVDKTSAVLRKVSRQIAAFGNSLRNIGRTFATTGLVTALPAAFSVKVFANFDDAMRRVEARSIGTTAQMDQLRESAKELGRTTSFTATQVGDLMGKLAQKNFSRKEIDDMTGSVLDLARAAGSGGEEDTVLSSDLISGTLRAFKMEAEEAARVADVFSEAVNNSNFDLQGLLDGMKKAAPLAKEYGLSLEETTASLAAMTNLNIEASEAGTAFQSFLARMSQSEFTDTFNKGLREAGRSAIQFTDSAGNLRSPLEIMQEIAIETEGMGTAVKGELLAALFGVRQFGKAAGSISGGKGAVELLEVLNNSGGKAADTAKAMDKGIGGSFRKIMSAAEGLAISIGESLAPGIQKLTDILTEYIGQATEWISNNKGTIILIGAVAAGVVGLGVALITTGIMVNILAAAFGGLATMIGLVKIAFVLLASILTSPFTIVAVAIGAVVVALHNMNEAFRESVGEIVSWAKEKFGEFAETVSKTFKGITMALGQGDFATAWDLVVQGATLAWLQFVDTLADAWGKFAGHFIDVWATTTGKMKELWADAQKRIANGILDLAEKEGILGDMMDLVLGVDVSAEKARGEKLARLSGDLNYDPLGDARAGMNQGFNQRIDAAKDIEGAISKWRSSTAEADKARDAEIEKRKKALDSLLEEVESRDALKEQLDEEIDQSEGDTAPGGRGGGPEGLSGPVMAPQISEALMAGTVQAAKVAYENSLKEAKGEDDLDQERNDLLGEIRDGVNENGAVMAP